MMILLYTGIMEMERQNPLVFADIRGGPSAFVPVLLK